MLRYLSRSVIRGKRVLLRVDFNVPMTGRRIQDDYRIRASLPTIRQLIRQGNTVVLLSHHSDAHTTLAPIAAYLSRFFPRRVHFVKNPFAGSFRSRIQRAASDELFLVENLTRWRGERSQDVNFAKRFSRLGDVFVNDSFGEAHRRRALITVIPRFLPSFLGPRFERELAELDRLLRHPAQPLIGIFGGAKIKTKLAILRRFRQIADQILVGGAVANTLLAARGVDVGRSRVERISPTLRRLARSPKLLLPIDAVVLRERPRRRVRITPITAIERDEVIYDVGPKTRRLFVRVAAGAGTVVWNGPMGLQERPQYSRGTRALAQALARRGRRVIVGGGDTVAFLARVKLLKKFKHVSTGGGAMLAYLAGEKLPALEALRR